MRGRRHVLADKIRADWQLPVAAVDEYGELDGLRTAHVDDGIESSANRAARVEHIVDEHDGLARDVDRQLRLMDNRLIRKGGKVIAVERNVENADRRLLSLDMLDIRRDALGDRNTARADADDDDVIDALVAFYDFVRDTRECAADALGVHDDGLIGQYWHKNPSHKSR